MTHCLIVFIYHTVCVIWTPQWIIFMVLLGQAQKCVDCGKVNFTDIKYHLKVSWQYFLINSMLNNQDSNLKSPNSLIGNKSKLTGHYTMQPLPYLPVYNARPCIIRTLIFDHFILKKRFQDKHQELKLPFFHLINKSWEFITVKPGQAYPLRNH